MAHSPSAKGRVERRNGLLQDRLVKEMRLAGINGLDKANEFLEEKFLPALNRQFNVQARSSIDVHRKAARNLDEVLGWEEKRVMAQDGTLVWNGVWFEIHPKHERLDLATRTVTVRELRDGRLQWLNVSGNEIAELPKNGEFRAGWRLVSFIFHLCRVAERKPVANLVSHQPVGWL